MDRIDDNNGEECDIGDWAFHYLDKNGYKKLKDDPVRGLAIGSFNPDTDYVATTKSAIDTWFS